MSRAGATRPADPKRPVVRDAAELTAALAPASAPHLLQLHLRGPGITEAVLVPLVRRGDLTALKCVSLAESAQGDAALAVLTRGPLLRAVRLLVLDRAGVTAAGVERLARAAPLGLATLSLANTDGRDGTPNQIDDAALRALARGSALRALESLDVSFNPCTADGLRALADAAAALPKLRQVTAWRTGLTEEGLGGLGALRFQVFSDFDRRIVDSSSG